MHSDTQGLFFILKKVKYGEADLILHALSSEGEKMSFLARVALKSKKRFAGGVLEPLHQVKLTYTQSQKSDLHTIKEAQLLQPFESLRTDYDKLTFALLALDCVAKVSLEGDSGSSSMYNLLGHMLRQLESIESLALIKTQFYLKFLLQQGVLEIEDWMKPFLRLHLSEVEQLQDYQSIAEGQWGCVEKTVLNYVKTASM